MAETVRGGVVFFRIDSDGKCAPSIPCDNSGHREGGELVDPSRKDRSRRAFVSAGCGVRVRVEQIEEQPSPAKLPYKKPPVLPDDANSEVVPAQAKVKAPPPSSADVKTAAVASAKPFLELESPKTTGPKPPPAKAFSLPPATGDACHFSRSEAAAKMSGHDVKNRPIVLTHCAESAGPLLFRDSSSATRAESSLSRRALRCERS